MLSHFVRTRRPILGVRIPLLRKTALRLLREGQTSLPLTGRSTYEELIVAGMIHFGDYTIADIKKVMHEGGVPTRMSW